MDKVINNSLQILRFSSHEIKVYVELLTNGPMTGYRLAQKLNIARANIYSVLERLRKREAVNVIEQEGGKAYAALPAREMLARLSKSHATAVQQADGALHALQPVKEEPLSWNLKGYDPILTKALALLETTQDQLLMGLWPKEAAELYSAVTVIQAKGIPITTLCLQGCAEECGSCCGCIYRYPLANESGNRWLVIAVDNREILIAQFHQDGMATATYSKLEVLVELGSHYLRNAIGIAEIVRSMGPRLLENIDQQALEALQGAGLAVNKVALFARFLSAVASKPQG